MNTAENTTISAHIQPNKRAMLEHIAKLFTGTATDNLIEIAWSSRDLKSLNGAKLFPATLERIALNLDRLRD